MRGGGPGTRELDLLDPAATVEHVDAFALSGGSVFGLETGARRCRLPRRARPRLRGTHRARADRAGAILFDLLNGGDKNWGRYPPYRELGYASSENRRRRFCTRQRRCRHRRDHGKPARRHRLGFRANASRRDRRRDCRRQCRGPRHDRRLLDTSGRRLSSREKSSAASAGRRHFPPMRMFRTSKAASGKAPPLP